jgi:hypothetical protein
MEIILPDSETGLETINLPIEGVILGAAYAVTLAVPFDEGFATVVLVKVILGDVFRVKSSDADMFIGVPDAVSVMF